MMRVSIGCRNRQVGSGWIGVDIERPEWADTYPDRFLQGDTLSLPLPDESVSELLAQHVFEHFHKMNGQRECVLKEWWRVLAPGGILRIIVPNAARYARLYCDGDWTAERFSDMMFATQNRVGEFHYACYDAGSLERFVKKHLGKRCRTLSIAFGQRGLFRIPDLEIRATFQKAQ